MNSVPRFQRSKGGISTVVATAAGCLGLFAAGVLGQGLLAEGLAAAFLTATAAIAGWMCGVRWGTAILALAAILEFALYSARVGEALLPFALRWGIAAGLLISTAWFGFWNRNGGWPGSIL